MNNNEITIMQIQSEIEIVREREREIERERKYTIELEVVVRMNRIGFLAMALPSFAALYKKESKYTYAILESGLYFVLLLALS